MNLVIVESPTKARTLSRFLGKDYKIDSTMGHVRDLPKNKIGVDVEKDFTPQYVLITKKKDAIDDIKKDAGEAEKIYLATDPDREGEAIAYHVSEILNGGAKLSRIVFHEITEEAVKQALSHARDIDEQLVDAQQARRVLDRLVGYKLSPLLWRKIRKGLSAGRVQSVAVRLIVEREREIEAFVPDEYWDIFAEVKTKVSKPEAFTAKLIEKNGKKIKVGNKKDADGVVSDLKKSAYSVSSIERKEAVSRPSPPFTTSTMTQAAARSFFWSAKRTMSIAQRLYEEGLITYHRTDSTNLAAEAAAKARAFIEKEYGKKYIPTKARFYKTKSKVAQEAHEAIRPTDVFRQHARLEGRLEKDAEKLYQLIWRRFVACQMEDARFDETTITVQAKNGNTYQLAAYGRVVKFDGYKKVYGDMDQDVLLPEVARNDKLDLVKIDPQQKFTQPPARYSEASLVKTLEKLGIGRPSTYAPIVSTIQDRQYVEKVEGRFHPTSLGIAVNDFLVKHFPGVVDYKFTAHMEDDLDEIANGKTKWVPVIKDFWEPFSKKLSGVEEKAERVKIETEKTGEVCPKCGEGEQVVRVGRFGKFLSCSRFPECDWSAPHIEKLKMSCPDCKKGEVVIRKTRKGKRFYGCSRYPDCKWASWRKPKV